MLYRLHGPMVVFLFCLPFFLGPSQDRYYLPIYPLLFLHGIRLYDHAWIIISGRARRAPGHLGHQRATD